MSLIYRFLWLIALFYSWLGMTLCVEDCLAELPPQVRVRVQSCQRGQCVTDYGNGVIVADNDGLLVLTCAHVIRSQGEIGVWVAGSWFCAQVLQKDEADDVAALVVQGEFDPVAVPVWSALDSVPVGAAVEVRSYWPTQQWQSVSHRTHRINSRWSRCLELHKSVPSGVSGSPVYSAAGLIGIVSATDDRSTLVVPITVIHEHYVRWGLIAARQQPAAAPLQHPPLAAGPSLTAPVCDCQVRIAAVEQRLSLSVQQLRLQIQELAADREHEQEWNSLREQFFKLQAEFEELAPLKQRRVILMTDGKVTTQRTLKPADPLVLGSEIVVRRQEAGGGR